MVEEVALMQQLQRAAGNSLDPAPRGMLSSLSGGKKSRAERIAEEKEVMVMKKESIVQGAGDRIHKTRDQEQRLVDAPQTGIGGCNGEDGERGRSWGRGSGRQKLSKSDRMAMERELLARMQPSEHPNQDLRAMPLAVAGPWIEMEEVMCPITLDVMYDPVMLVGSGIPTVRYELADLVEWLVAEGIDPITRDPVSPEVPLQIDLVTREQLAHWRSANVALHIARAEAAGCWEEAMGELQQAIELDPRRVSLYSTLADLLETNSRCQEATAVRAARTIQVGHEPVIAVSQCHDRSQPVS
eukprot:TRINITY_DN2201_c0_g1_i1.p1 TRINITY_DN2201_c0_g1~~TRINITY_DN2201_c0_g1_i1.p1  ORF type:complete len:299 (-),score=58.84 TRINITY_DN2201_c0_g1_i1:1065-1961(-)